MYSLAIWSALATPGPCSTIAGADWATTVTRLGSRVMPPSHGMLDFETYFNATASNVLYSYWSHDIGGHNQADHIDPELYTRWMQFGLFSPILRTHSTKDSRLNKEPWAFSYEYTTILRDIIKKRYHCAALCIMIILRLQRPTLRRMNTCSAMTFWYIPSRLL